MREVVRGERQWPRRQVDFQVRVVFPSRGVREVSEAKLRMRDISEGGAAIHTGGLTVIPDFFYLQFGDDSSELVSCYVVRRTPETLHCKFNTEMATDALERILVEQRTLAFIDEVTEQAIAELYDDLLKHVSLLDETVSSARRKE